MKEKKKEARKEYGNKGKENERKLKKKKKE